VSFPANLPNRNTPFAKIIAKEIDKLPDDTYVIVNSCCWGEWGQPEPDAIRFSMKKKREVFFFDSNTTLRNINYANLNNLQLDDECYIVSDPRMVVLNKEYLGCHGLMTDEIIQSNGYSVARIFKNY
jgi:hypothetical protein